MDLQLHGKVAIVTGASRGIGKAIAATLAAEGCHLAIVAHGRKALEDAAAELRDQGATVQEIVADLTEPEASASIVEITMGHYGKIDIVVHNAGGAKGQDIFDTSDQEWEDALALNILALTRLVRLVAPIMSRQGEGRIITISS